MCYDDDAYIYICAASVLYSKLLATKSKCKAAER